MIKEIYSTYLELAAVLVERAKVTLNNSNSADPLALSSVIIIEHFIKHAERQIDQITRRVLEDEKIPHSEKVFSIFEEHTEWLSKGKAGVPQVLGLNVCVITDQYGFILEHLVMQKETDSGIAVKIIRNAIAKFPNITSCSFDKGFLYSSLEKSPLFHLKMFHFFSQYFSTILLFLLGDMTFRSY